MIAVFITFRYGEDFSAAKVRQLANNARATFENMPGLRSKVFSVFPELREARNVYVWELTDYYQHRRGIRHAQAADQAGRF
jgi:hypothetical protein